MADPLGLFSNKVEDSPFYQDTKSKYDALDFENSALFDKANAVPKVSGTDATIAAIISALPVAIGYALAGGSGVAIGGKAAAEGVGGSVNTLQALAEADQKSALNKYTLNNKEQEKLGSQLFELRKAAQAADINAQQTNANHEFTAEQNSLSRQNSADIAAANRSNTYSIAEQNRLAADARVGKSAQANAEAKAATLAKAMENPEFHSVIEARLAKTMSPEKAKVIAGDPNLVSQLMSFDKEVAQAVSRYASQEIGEKNVELRKSGQEIQRAGQIAQYAGKYREEYLKQPQVQKASAAMDGLNEMATMLASNSSVGSDALRSMWMRSVNGEKGTATEGDVQRSFANTFGGEWRKVFNAITGETNDYLSPEQRQTASKILREVAEHNRNILTTAAMDMAKTGQFTLPGLKPEERKTVEDVVPSRFKTDESNSGAGKSVTKTIQGIGPVQLQPTGDGYYTATIKGKSYRFPANKVEQ